MKEWEWPWFKIYYCPICFGEAREYTFQFRYAYNIYYPTCGRWM